MTLRRIILINILIIFLLFIILEMSARIFLYFTRGSSTVGMPEKTVYLGYRPFVMFGPDWDKLLDTSLYPIIKDRKPVHRILLLGASTAELFPTKILEDALHKKFPQEQFEVINGATGCYIARQEVVVGAIWGPAFSPDIIVTLDGANDLIHRLRMKKAGTFYLDDAYDLALKEPFLSPFAHLIRHSQIIQGIGRLEERMSIHSYQQYEDAVPVYISAEHSINVIAKGLSAKRIMVLQPFISFKVPLSQPEENFKYYQYRETVIKKLYSLMDEQLVKLATQDDVKYIDGRYIFSGVNKTVFSDDVHFVNNDGYEILATKIVDLIDKNDLKIK